jgi:D-amino peptidase
VSLNGTPVSETVFNAAVAGQHGVPVVMISGDDAAIADARATLGEIEAVETKRALGFHSAASLPPEAACKRIAEGMRRALERIGEFRPYVIATPVTVEVGFQSYRPVELLAYLRGTATRRPTAATPISSGGRTASVSYRDVTPGVDPPMRPPLPATALAVL